MLFRSRSTSAACAKSEVRAIARDRCQPLSSATRRSVVYGAARDIGSSALEVDDGMRSEVTRDWRRGIVFWGSGHEIRSDGISTMSSLLWRCCVGAAVRGSCVGLLESDCTSLHIGPSSTSSLVFALRSLKRSSSGLPLLPPASPDDDHGLRPRSPSSWPETCGEPD